MDTIAIMSNKPFSLDTLKETLSKRWPVETSVYGAVVVGDSSSRVYIYEDDESKDVNVFTLWVDYTSVELVKAVLEDIADDPELIVDNDFGTVLSGSEFVARCRAEPDWNWRDQG
jgi:hypothetical protein